MMFRESFEMLTLNRKHDRMRFYVWRSQAHFQLCWAAATFIFISAAVVGAGHLWKSGY